MKIITLALIMLTTSGCKDSTSGNNSLTLGSSAVSDECSEEPQNDDAAILDAELRYIMKTGKSFQDSKNRIYLVWDDSSSDWKFLKKAPPP